MNEKDIHNLKWDGKDQRVRIDHGLYLNIRRSSKTYLMRKMMSGKTNLITLGKSPAVSLREARLKAAQFLNSQNISNATVTELTNKYYGEVVEPQSKVPKQVLGYLNHINDRLGNSKVMDVSTSECVAFIQHYSKTRGARSSDRLRSYLIQIFSYAVELGIIQQSELMHHLSQFKRI